MTKEQVGEAEGVDLGKEEAKVSPKCGIGLPYYDWQAAASSMVEPMVEKMCLLNHRDLEMARMAMAVREYYLRVIKAHTEMGTYITMGRLEERVRAFIAGYLHCLLEGARRGGSK